jgi:hypothetical protein
VLILSLLASFQFNPNPTLVKVVLTARRYPGGRIEAPSEKKGEKKSKRIVVATRRMQISLSGRLPGANRRSYRIARIT